MKKLVFKSLILDTTIVSSAVASIQKLSVEIGQVADEGRAGDNQQ